MLKGTYTPVRNKCKMLKIVYNIKNLKMCISQGYRNEYLVMLFAPVVKVYIAAKNPPEVIGCEKIIHDLLFIKSARIRYAYRCSALFSRSEKKYLYLLCRLLGELNNSNFFLLLEKNDLLQNRLEANNCEFNSAIKIIAESFKLPFFFVTLSFTNISLRVIFFYYCISVRTQTSFHIPLFILQKYRIERTDVSSDF
jgi:hypothetical protein